MGNGLAFADSGAGGSGDGGCGIGASFRDWPGKENPGDVGGGNDWRIIINIVENDK